MNRSCVRRVALILVALLCLPALALGEGQTFSIRGGIRFGMTPEEVIAIEESNGFHYDLTTDGEVLYDAGDCYNLYYQSEAGKIGDLPLMRYEYDFDLRDMRLFQFYYVSREAGAYDYLLPRLEALYGPSDLSITASTLKYDDTGSGNHANRARWAVRAEDEVIVIDLWDNSYGVCFLSYQTSGV